MEWDTYNAALRPIVAGRRVICIGSAVTAFSGIVTTLRACGAGDIMVVGYQWGQGPAPQDVVTFNAALEPTGSQLDILRYEEAFKANPPQALLDKLDDFDLDRSALVIGQFVNTVQVLGGRPFLAYRKPAWLGLEDKVVIDAFFDRAGVTHAPSTVVAPTADALEHATRSIDSGNGVVWSGDAREGFSGGAELVRRIPHRWVHHADERSSSYDDAIRFFAERCDEVRVMPYLDGVPCSIHGIVIDDAVITIRPVEMIVLHNESDPTSFAYLGCASFYDPPNDVREQMVVAAERVGKQLQAEVGFAGCFTLDGVATANGFLPTEVNPRQGAGLMALQGAWPSLSLGLILDAIAGGHRLAIDPKQFQADLTIAADNIRSGGTWRMTRSSVTIEARPMTFDVNTEKVVARWCEEGEVPLATVIGGPRASAGFARCNFTSAVPKGPSVRPLAAAFWRFANEELAAGLDRFTTTPSDLAT